MKNSILLIILFLYITTQILAQNTGVGYYYNKILNRELPDSYYDQMDEGSIYMYDYTANGYVVNRTEEEYKKAKRNVDAFVLNKDYKPNFNLAYCDSLISMLVIRELFFDKYNPILDYYPIPLSSEQNVDTNQVKLLTKEIQEEKYIKKPIEKYGLFRIYDEYIDSLYRNVILKKEFKENDNKLIYNEIIRNDRDTFWVIARLLQLEDFTYRNFGYDKKGYLEMLNQYFDLAVRIPNMSTYDGISIFLMLSEGYSNIGEKYLAYKSNLYAFNNSKLNSAFYTTPTDLDYIPIKQFISLYSSFNKNYFLRNKLSIILSDYANSFGSKKPPTIQIWENDKCIRSINYDFLIYRGCTEFLNAVQYNVFNDSLKQYAAINILNKIIIHYKYSIEDSFDLSPSVLSLYNQVLAVYVNKYFKHEKDLNLYYTQKAFDYSLGNFEYKQFEDALYNYLRSLITNGKYNIAEKIINRFADATYLVNDYNNYDYIKYFYFLNYLDQKNFDSALVIKNMIKDHQKSKPYNNYALTWSLYNAELDWAKAINDTFNIERYGRLLNIHNSYIPIKEYGEIIKVEEEFNKVKLYSDYYANLQLKNKQLDSTNIALLEQIKVANDNKELAIINAKDARKQKDIAFVNAAEAKRNRDTAESRLKIISLQNDELMVSSSRIDGLNSDLNDRIIKLNKANDDLNEAINTKNSLIIVIGLLAALLAYLFYKSKQTNKQLSEVTIKNLKLDNEKQRAEASLIHKLLTIHNFKGIETGKDKIYKFNEDNDIPILKDAYSVLESTFEYTKQLLKNLREGTVSIYDEFYAIKNYFETIKLSNGKSFNLILPESSEVDKYKEFKIIANTLQPIIENIINYSEIEKCGENGKDGIIKISFHQINNNTLQININDNGANSKINDRIISKNKTGLSLELLEELIDKYNKGSGNKIMSFNRRDDLKITPNNSNCIFHLYKN